MSETAAVAPDTKITTRIEHGSNITQEDQRRLPWRPTPRSLLGSNTAATSRRRIRD